MSALTIFFKILLRSPRIAARREPDKRADPDPAWSSPPGTGTGFFSEKQPV